MMHKTENAGKIGYFMSADAVKFRKPVFPGDTLFIHCEMLSMKRRLGKAACKCLVNQEVVSEAELLLDWSTSDSSSRFRPGMIHPTAIVHAGAQVADDGRSGARGYDCPAAFWQIFDVTATIGQANRFFPFSSIGQRSQDLKYRGEPTFLEIGDHNSFREFCTVESRHHAGYEDVDWKSQ